MTMKNFNWSSFWLPKNAVIEMNQSYFWDCTEFSASVPKSLWNFWRWSNVRITCFIQKKLSNYVTFKAVIVCYHFFMSVIVDHSMTLNEVAGNKCGRITDILYTIFMQDASQSQTQTLRVLPTCHRTDHGSCQLPVEQLRCYSVLEGVKKTAFWTVKKTAFWIESS